MKRSAALCAVLLVMAPTAACRREPPDDEAAVKESLAQKATVEVLEETAAAEYDPPADGKVTEAQIELYLAVKQREQRIREVAGADALAADLRAAQELGHNPKEHQWVAERVMEALLSDLRGRLEVRLTEGREQYVQLLEAQKEKVTDPGQLARLDEQIAEARRDMDEQSAAAAAEPPSEALVHNAALVELSRDRIQAVLTPEERFAVGEWEGEEPAAPPAGEQL